MERIRLKIETADRPPHLGPDDFYVVPRGVGHRLVAKKKAHLLVIKPADTPKAGDDATAAEKIEI